MVNSVKKIIATSLASMCVLCGVSAGCTNVGNEVSSMKFSKTFLNTDFIMIVTDNFSDSQIVEKFNKFTLSVNAFLRDLENSLSTTVESSYISLFNEAQAGEVVELNKTAYTALNLAISAYQNTDGYFNPAVYYNVELYGFSPKSTDLAKNHGTQFVSGEGAVKLPDEEYVQAFSQLATHFKDVKTEEKDGKYYAYKPEDAFTVIDEVTYPLKIDLGGIGKGYAVDVADSMLNYYGFKYGNISFGTSSISLKEFYGEEKYILSLRCPRPIDFEETFIKFQLENVFVTTSGDYEKYYTYDDKRYSHIIDPTTGKPVDNGIYSASVIGLSGAEGDAITTALMVMGLQNAVEYINTKLSDKQVVLVYGEGEKLYLVTNIPTQNFEYNTSRFTILSTIDENGKIVIPEQN